MAGGQTTIQGADRSSNPVSLLAGSDSNGNVAFAHVLYDVTGGPFAVSANPAFTRNLTAENAAGSGTDASGAAPSALATLATFTVAQPGCYYVQNQSAATLQVIFSDGTGGTASTMLLGPGAGAGSQGGDTAPAMAWFKGKIIVAGPAGSQFMARHN